jgi:hypothetical protein
MASIGTNESTVGIKTGATWDTASDMTSGGQLFRVSNFSVNARFGEHEVRDIGFDNFQRSRIKLNQECDVTISADITHEGLWLKLLAAFLGSSTGSPAEQTGGQGDYLHVMQMASSPTKFVTLAWLCEDDYVLEIPSFKPASISIQWGANTVGTFTCTGIASRVVDNASATNSVSDLSGLSYPTTYEPAVLGGVDATSSTYFRFDDYSSSVALSSDDNKAIMNFNLNMSRPLQRRNVLRGADSAYTLEPHQAGLIQSTISFQMSEVDNAQIDGIADWLASDRKMAELAVVGDQIGSGLNSKILMRFAQLEHVGQMPTGYDIPGNNQLMQPTFTFNVLSVTTQPASMGGTGYFTASVVNNIASSYS